MAPPNIRGSSSNRKAQLSVFTGYLVAAAGAAIGAALLIISLWQPQAVAGLRTMVSDAAALGLFPKPVTEARAAAMQASGPAEAGQAEGMLSQALGGLRVVAEQYPELRATENFQQLSRNLSELEDEIQASRRIYNSNVQAYNTKIQVFPNSVVANSGGFEPREFFEVEDAADREVPEVSFTQPPPAAPAG